MDHVIANDFKNIFKHAEKFSEPWRAYLRAFMMIFLKIVKINFDYPDTIIIRALSGDSPGYSPSRKNM